MAAETYNLKREFEAMINGYDKLGVSITGNNQRRYGSLHALCNP